MKKTLAWLLSALMLITACLSAGAITLESVENAAEAVDSVLAEAAENTEEAALAAEINPETDAFHETYGDLVYYSDFDSFTADTVLSTNGKSASAVGVYGGNAVIGNGDSGSTVTAITAPCGEDTTNIALQIEHYNNSSAKWPQVYINNIANCANFGAGVYTVIYDIYVPEGKTAKNLTTWYVDCSVTTDNEHRIKYGNPANGSWITVTSSDEDPKDKISSIGIYLDNVAATYATNCFYVDNFRVYCKKYVTLTTAMLNLPEDVTGGYVVSKAAPTGGGTFTSEGLKTLMYDELPSIYVPGYTFLGWFDSEGNQVMGTLETETPDITARWQKWGPGLNMLTGTTSPVTFENGFKYNVGLGDMGTVAVTDNISAAEGSVNTSSKVLMAKKGTRGGEFVGLNLPVVFESGRRYDIKYDVYATATDVSTIVNQSWFYDLNGHNTTPGFSNGYASGKDKWYSLSTDITPTDTNATRGYAFIQNKLANGATNAKNVTVYYDNISFTPWYRVYYMEADGVTVNDQWYEKPSATAGGISQNVNPIWNGEGNMKLVGWSLEGVNGTPISGTSYTLTPGEDLYLYPVYEDAGKEYFRNNVVAATNTGGQHVFVNKLVDTGKTTCNVGRTGATVTYNEQRNSYVVKGANVSGEITFNLVFTDGTEATGTVYLVGATSWKPGLNTYTGTTKPLDFEAFTTADLAKALDDGSDKTSKFSIQTNPDKTGNNTSDKMVSISAAFQYLYNKDFDPNIEPARPVHFSYDIKSNKGQYLMINSWGGNDLYTSPAASTSWTTRNYKLCMATSTGDLKNGKETEAKTKGINIIGIGPQNGTYAYNTEGKDYQYIDNLMIVPGYKITYVIGDTEKVEYVLYSNETTREIATTYTPWGLDKLVVPYTGEGLKKHIGWATEGVTEAMATVPLRNEDIELYPIFAETDSAIDGNAFMSGKTDTVATFKFVKDIDAASSSFTAGTTDVTSVVYDEAANTCTVTAAGYSGILTLNVVYADATTETVEVKLLGGENWKPGLNLITGTTDTFDFENAEESKLAFAMTQGTALVENTKSSDANNSGYVVKMGYDSTAQNGIFPLLTSKQTEVIEKERGVFVKLDYVGNWHAFWVIPKENCADYNVSATADDSADADWKTSYKHYSNGKNNFEMTRLQVKSTDDNKQNPREVLVDNVAFIPAYKFTYIDLDGSENVVYMITDGEGNIITTHTPVFASGATKYVVNDGTSIYTGAYTLTNEDVVFTAVPDLGIDETVTSRIDKNGDKVTGGIRFKASIALADKDNEAVSEYGFIVAREAHLTKLGSELNHEFMHPTFAETPLYVTGVSFNRAEGVDKVFDKDDTNCYFTGVCVNIPTETAATVKENLVARPYMAVKIGEKTVYVYGKTNKYSLGQAMLDVQTAGGTDYTNNQVYVDSIVDLYNTAE